MRCAGRLTRAQLRCSGLGDVTLTDEPDPAVLEGVFPDFEGVSDECESESIGRPKPLPQVHS